MYANYFGFRDIPFRQLSDHRYIFLSPGFLAAETELQEAIRNHARLILLTGHAGTGKTKLLSHLQMRLDETRPVFYLPYSALQIEDFIGFVAAALDIHLPDGSDIFSSLQEGLTELSEDGDKPVLLLDDAHSLGCDVLENLIGLFQLGAGEQPLAQLVLAAHPEIEYTLERPELRELEENLARMSRLHPLDREDVEPYIDYALGAVRYDNDPVFSPEAIQAIATHTRGIPQLINTLCGASFLVAYGRDENPVSVKTVEAAIEEVAGIAMVDTVERDAADMDTIWFDDIEPTPRSRPLPGIVQAWLKRSRRWPIAAVGVGGSVALVAILVLVGTVPFENNSASARQHDLTGALNQRISQLSSEVTKANGERDRLRVELSAQVSERDALAGQLAHLEAIHLAEMTLMGEIPEPTPTDEVASVTVAVNQTNNETGSAEDLLAELMRTAESEADSVTSALVESVPEIKQGSYQVRPGNTLWKIATQHKMKVETLKALNDMGDGNTLIVGRKLIVGDAPAVTTTMQMTSHQTMDGEWYVVRAGDSLYGIGRKFESSVDELLRWNQLANADNLKVGQRLRLFPNE